jgi:hypothetical protein
LSHYIDKAIAYAASEGLIYNKDSMKIYKAEVLVEVKRVDIVVPIHGVATLDVGALRLYTEPCYSDSDCYSPYVCDLTTNQCVKCDSNHVEVGGFNPNNACEYNCGAYLECDEKFSNVRFWGDNGQTLKMCDDTCVYSEQAYDCPGDITFDGRVDMKDIAIVARKFGVECYEPWCEPGYSCYGDYSGCWGVKLNKWDPITDLNGDGKIDIRDIVIMAMNYGKVCTAELGIASSPILIVIVALVVLISILGVFKFLFRRNKT